jgi:hypothetical protein
LLAAVGSVFRPKGLEVRSAVLIVHEQVADGSLIYHAAGTVGGIESLAYLERSSQGQRFHGVTKLFGNGRSERVCQFGIESVTDAKVKGRGCEVPLTGRETCFWAWLESSGSIEGLCTIVDLF